MTAIPYSYGDVFAKLIAEQQREDAQEWTLTPCPICGGDGWFNDEHPTPTPQGPHYQEPIRCAACNGTGEIEVLSELIEEDDLPKLAEDAQRKPDLRTIPNAFAAMSTEAIEACLEELEWARLCNGGAFR